MEESISSNNKQSYFDGSKLQLTGWKLLGGMITLFTFGICYPWAFCMVYRWEAKHTVIDGNRLQFDGTAMQLFGKWILWMFLSVITFGIYVFSLNMALKKWKVKHTHFIQNTGELQACPNDNSKTDSMPLIIVGGTIAALIILKSYRRRHRQSTQTESNARK